MRLVPVLIALVVAAGLYFLVFERDTVMTFAGRPAPDAAEATSPTDMAVAESAEATEPQTEPTAEPPQTAAVAPADSAPPATEATDLPRVSVVALASTAGVIDRAVLLRGRTQAAREVEVRSETTGLIVSEPRPKGTFVEAGALLCQIDPGTREATLAEAEARLAEAIAEQPVSAARVTEAEARLEEAVMNDNAASRLSESGFAADTRVAATKATVSAARAALESARSGEESAAAKVQSAQASVALARKEIERLTITAPFDGLLETDTAELGALMQQGSPCATVLQLDPIRLVGFVPEADVEKVETGAPAQAQLVSGRSVTGEVTFVGRSADPMTRTFRVEVTVANDDLSLRDGQTAEIAIAAAGARAHLIPASALTLDDQGEMGVRIAIETEDGPVAGFSAVQVLRDTTTGVYVSGLPEVAQVIVVGQEYVTDGVPLTVTLTDMEAARAPAPGTATAVATLNR